ncbi:uncharacterized protein LOC128548431 [Mercenaria mercenaria]|uniref:uncharacterized protein LOC128548431 n=1 Tax=Mercenaria mercenaria TaxID=6596 RepID=UPI00234F1BC9|nr:uncharacterized protein LOC128548431 [Mercenaria mercenaria]
MGSQEHSDMEFVTYGQLREILDGYVQRSEFRELKRRIENAPLVNEMEQELEEIIKRQKNAYMAVEAGMCHLFTTEEINTHSATGKKPNRSTPAKPKFDPWRYDLMAELVKKHFGISNKEIILKTQNVKRKFAKKDC